MTDSLRQLSDAGVAIWLDDMSRGRLVTGTAAMELHRDGPAGLLIDRLPHLSGLSPAKRGD